MITLEWYYLATLFALCICLGLVTLWLMATVKAKTTMILDLKYLLDRALDRCVVETEKNQVNLETIRLLGGEVKKNGK